MRRGDTLWDILDRTPFWQLLLLFFSFGVGWSVGAFLYELAKEAVL